MIKIHLHNLNEHDKVKLNEYGINSYLNSSNTLFNYPSFIKCINTLKIAYYIKNYLNVLYAKFSTSTTSTTLEFIYESLFKVFINNNKVNLHTFEIEMYTYKDYDYFNITFQLILYNPNFICNIKNFKIYALSTKIESFLSFLSSNCNLILTSGSNRYRISDLNPNLTGLNYNRFEIRLTGYITTGLNRLTGCIKPVIISAKLYNSGQNNINFLLRR